MYRYSPPKSHIWGHSLRKMEPTRQKALFGDFLKKAVAEHSITGGSLTLLTGPAPAFFPPKAQGMWRHVTREDVERFERLLGVAAQDTSFYSLTPQQWETALAELVRDRALLPGAVLLQAVEISKWLIEGRPAKTRSRIHLYYGMKPCISTFLQFETTGQFEFVRRVLSDLHFCRLNEKHLKPVKRQLKTSIGGEDDDRAA